MLATLAPLLVTFVGFLWFGLAHGASPGSALKGATATFLIALGPFTGDALRGLEVSSVILLGALAWTVIALLVWKTRAGNAHWILYAAATSAWLGVGLNSMDQFM